MGELKPVISAFDVFNLFDIRVGKVAAVNAATGLRVPSRHLQIDIGREMPIHSVGQFDLVDPHELLDRLVVVCRNLGAKRIGAYTSEALVLGTPHPDSPPGQHQALPLWADARSQPGDEIF